MYTGTDGLLKATSQGEAEYLQDQRDAMRTFTEVEENETILYKCNDCGAVHSEQECDCK